MDLPDAFCWTKYGDEAGEAISSILRRKDAEREANGGLFLWGIGTSIRPSLLKLLSDLPAPEVIFSPMLSAPTPRDVSPKAVAVWHRARGLDGELFELPPHTMVTSRLDVGVHSKRHYALVCESSAPLAHDDGFATRQWIDDALLRNLASGRPLGGSQVTSVVRRTLASESPRRRYRVGFRATLQYPYFVELFDFKRVAAVRARQRAPTLFRAEGARTYVR